MLEHLPNAVASDNEASRTDGDDEEVSHHRTSHKSKQDEELRKSHTQQLRKSHQAVAEALDEEAAVTLDPVRQLARKGTANLINSDELPAWRKLCHKFVSWPGFDSFIGMIILANGLTIGVDTQVQARIPLGCDDNCVCVHPGTVCRLADPWVAIVDYAFFGIYILELVLRFCAFGPRVVKSNWVKFDMFLVASATADILLKATAVEAEFLKQVMLVRLLRLARLARLVRLIVQFQTLWKLVNGLMSCANTLFWTFLLMSILSYIGALFGMDLCDYDLSLPPDHPYNVAALEYFRGLDNSVFTLVQLFTFDSIAAIYRPLVQHRPWLFFYFMAVLLVLSIALMNLVTAIMVEGALAIAEQDKSLRKNHEQAKKKRQMAQLKLMFDELDEDGSGELTLDEINSAPAVTWKKRGWKERTAGAALGEWIEDGKHYQQYVSNQAATRLDVIQLQEALDQRLMERQARETGICPVREELYSQCFDELIRQVTINCPERGLLLLRVRDEIRMSIAAYQTLYQSSVTFGTRKQLQSEQGKAETEQMIAEHEEQKKQREARVVELKNKCEAIERREAERRAVDERKRKEEIDFLKHQQQHLESFLKSHDSK
eukprot:s48_g42.t1